MKPLYTQQEYDNSKSTQKLPCECYQCGDTFYKLKKEITSHLNGNPKHSIKYCSLKCVGDSNKVIKTIKCDNCGNNFDKLITKYGYQLENKEVFDRWSNDGYGTVIRTDKETYQITLKRKEVNK